MITKLRDALPWATGIVALITVTLILAYVIATAADTAAQGCLP